MRDAVTISLKRTAELCAIFTIGNGIVGLLQPERHLALWQSDVPAIDRFSRTDRERTPAQRSAYALVQIGAGLLVAAALRPSAHRG